MRTSPGNYFVAATLSYKERELCHVSKIQHSELQKSPFIPPYKGELSHAPLAKGRKICAANQKGF